MYWLPKMNKTSFGTRFTVASKKYSARSPSVAISKICKMVFNTIDSFHNKSFFHSGCKKFWVVENSFLIVIKLHKISVKTKAKSIELLTLAPYIQRCDINSS